MTIPDLEITIHNVAKPRKLHTSWSISDEEEKETARKILNGGFILDEDRSLKQDMEKRYPGKKLVGFWRHEKEQDVDLPWPADFVDKKQDEKLLKTVAEYLDDQGFMSTGWMGPSQCRICGAYLGSHDFEDDQWVWPERLSHYLLEHKVKLPKEFIEHVLCRTTAEKENIKLVHRCTKLESEIQQLNLQIRELELEIHQLNNSKFVPLIDALRHCTNFGQRPGDRNVASEALEKLGLKRNGMLW